MSGEVTDNRARNRFELVVDGVTAHIDYERKPDPIVLIHTIVPKEIGGRGVGTQIIKSALDMIRAEGIKMVPQCPFVAAFLKKHPEYNDLVAG